MGGEVAFGDIAAALLPRTDGIVLVMDIMLYLMFFLNLIAFFGQDDKQIAATMLVGGTLLAIVIGKLSTFYAGGDNPIEFIEADEMPMLIINSIIFLIPIIVTGMSKAKKTKPLTIIAGSIGGAYFFMFWFFFQRNG
ncbi:MAG: hypothetical protein AAF125_15005 [Chloroflexota bacterium]